MSFEYFIFLFPFILPEIVYSQNGGQNSFSFLNIEHSPRIEALGGGPISIIDDDVSIIQSNPSLLNSKMHNEFYFSFPNAVVPLSIIPTLLLLAFSDQLLLTKLVFQTN